MLIADRKSTRLNSSHMSTSYAVFCLKKKKITSQILGWRRYRESYSAIGAKSGPRAPSITAQHFASPSRVKQAFQIDFFFNDTATTEIYTLSLHDALPI